MTDFNVRSFAELHSVLSTYRKDKIWIFRGQSNKYWPIVPKVGREGYEWVSDKDIFDSWKRRAVEFLRDSSISEWDWLAIAQHHGLATRLLDWSTNPLIAAYFACSDLQEVDGAVYAVILKDYVDVNKDTEPMKYDKISVYRPKGLSSRIVRQGGHFTIHPAPSVALTPQSDGVLRFDKINILRDCKNAIRSELSFYGVNSSTIFPDLDGLSSFINWAVETKEYWVRSSSRKPATKDIVIGIEDLGPTDTD